MLEVDVFCVLIVVWYAMVCWEVVYLCCVAVVMFWSVPLVCVVYKRVHCDACSLDVEVGHV